jgi:16S rRNA (uracil1498-N3)-methyltransferase
MRRWREVVRGAAALGQRGLVPAVLEPATPAEAVVAAVAAGMQAYLLYEGLGLESLSTVAFDTARPVAIIVGPEGGWSEAEVATMHTAGAVPVTLGPRIMRPLPAALAALSVVFHRAGELQLPKGERG